MTRSNLHRGNLRLKESSDMESVDTSIEVASPFPHNEPAALTPANSSGSAPEKKQRKQLLHDEWIFSDNTSKWRDSPLQ